jgi:hypothetical protein
MLWITTNSAWSATTLALAFGAFAFLLIGAEWHRIKRKTKNEDCRNEVDGNHNGSEECVVDTTGLDQEQPLDDPIRFLNVETWNLDISTEEFIRKLPKVELHVHLDGAFDSDILWRHLYEKEMIQCLPVSTTLPWDQSLLAVR